MQARPWFLAVGLLAAGGALGDNSAPVSPTASAAPDAPSAELLEFLGSFTTADGRWVDPMALADGTATTSSTSNNNADRHSEAKSNE